VGHKLLKKPERGEERRSGTRSVVLWLAVTLMLTTLSLSVLGCDDPMKRAADLEDAGDVEGAIAVYQDILANEPDSLAALSGEAVCLVMLRRYDEALPLQEKVIALDKKDVLTRVELGFNYLNHQDRSADAVRVLSEARSLEPTGKHLVYLAQAQVATGDAAGAESTLREALEVDPLYAHAYAQLVDLLEGQDRSQEAEEVRELALTRGVDLTTAE
jgi:tetratricopeptide (TPR) repeat protein